MTDKKKAPSNAGRKKLPEGAKRVRLACMIAPETETALNGCVRADDPRDNVGRVLDRLIEVSRQGQS